MSDTKERPIQITNPLSLETVPTPLPTDSVIADTSIYLDDYVDGASTYLIPEITGFLQGKTLPYLGTVQQCNLALGLRNQLSPFDISSSHITTVTPEMMQAYERTKIIMGYMPEINWDLPVPDPWLKMILFAPPRTNAQFAVRLSEMRREIEDVVRGETPPGVEITRDFPLLRTVAFFQAGVHVSPSYKI